MGALTKSVTKDSDIITIPVTQDMLDFARVKAAQMGKLNEYSMMQGRRNIEGILGEMAAFRYLEKAIMTDTRDHDLSFGKVTIDVKTKRMTRKPRIYYDATVYGYNPNQNCHVYLFAGVDPEHSVVWLSGYLTKQGFYDRALFCPKGSKRSLGKDKELIYREDNYVVQVNQLNTVASLKETLMAKFLVKP